MKAIDINAALEATKQIKRTTDALRSRRAELLEKKNALEESNQVVYRQPLRKSEILQLIVAQIDKHASEYTRAAKWDAMFNDFVFPKGARPRVEGPVDLNPIYYAQTNAAISLQDLDAGRTAEGQYRVLLASENLLNFFGGADPSNKLEVSRACFFFGDIIKKKIETHFEHFYNAAEKKALPFAAPSKQEPATVEEKRAAIEANDEKIALLDGELADVDTQLKALSDAGGPVEKIGGAQ